MKAKFLTTVAVSAVLSAPPLLAADLVVQMRFVDDRGVGAEVGTVTVGEGPQGLVFTPKLKGDNYADAPAPLGGGGTRIACGVIK